MSMLYGFQALAIASSVALFAYFTIKWIRYSYRLRHFRGPLSFPLIGSCYTSAVLTLLKHLSSLRSKYGKIFVFYSFDTPMLVVTDPVVVRYVLSSPKIFLKGADYRENFFVTFGNGLVTSNGEDHRKGRQVLGKYFIRASIAKSVPDMHIITKKMFAEFVTPKLSEMGELTFNIEEFFAIMALRNFLMFSCHYDSSSDGDFEKLICHSCSEGSCAVGRSIMFKEPNWSILPGYRIQIKFNNVMEILFRKIVDIKQAQQAKGEEVDDPLTELIKDDTITSQDRLDHFKTLIAAGHDTTAYFMSYLAYLLARHPAIQTKLVNYLQEQLGDKEDVTADDLVKLKYFNCVMMETLRMYSIIPMVSRECAEDTHIKEAGITIPKNVPVMIPMIVMNKDPNLWENPSEFNPARFENKESADFTSAKDGFFPFAYGTRTCIGNTFAQIESAIAFIHLLREYEILEKPGFRPKILAGISLTTSNGIHVRLQRRKLKAI